MSKLDDLQTLKRLLKDFKFPVSPILEYAIKEKEAELCAECHSVNKEDSKFEQTERAVDNEQISFTSLKDEFYNYLYSTKSEFAARNYIRCLDKPIRTFIKAIDSEAAAEALADTYNYKEGGEQ